MKTDATKPGQGNGTAGLKLGEATLAGVPGAGVIQVMRSQSGGILQIVGTWRLEDENGHDGVGQLKRACATGEPVRYRGKLYDPQEPARDQIDLDVKVGWYQTYSYQAEALSQSGPNASPTKQVTLYRLVVDTLPSAVGSDKHITAARRTLSPVASQIPGGIHEPAPLR